MVDHQLCHAAVNADVFSGNEARLVGAEKHHHIRDIHRIPDTPGGLLQGIRAFIHRIGRIDPSPVPPQPPGF